MVEDLKKCIFFDRDGIVNHSPGAGWVEHWSDFHLFPEFVDVLRYVQSRGYMGIIITNQSAVARGIMDERTVQDIHQRLRLELSEHHNLSIQDIFYCPHYIEDHCDCRKPKPGLLLLAAERHGIDLAQSWMIGDRESDVQTGQAAGCRTILVHPNAEDTKANYHVQTMAVLKSRIADIL